MILGRNLNFQGRMVNSKQGNELSRHRFYKIIINTNANKFVIAKLGT